MGAMIPAPTNEGSGQASKHPYDAVGAVPRTTVVQRGAQRGVHSGTITRPEMGPPRRVPGRTGGKESDGGGVPLDHHAISKIAASLGHQA